MKVLLWLDDLRNPFEGEWLKLYAPDYLAGDCEVVWVKSYDDYVAWIKANGLPDKIAFDHDLGELEAQKKVQRGMSKKQARLEKKEAYTGMDAVKWTVDYCIDNKKHFPSWVIQSANPVGAKNMSSLIINFIKHSERARNSPPL